MFKKETQPVFWASHTIQGTALVMGTRSILVRNGYMIKMARINLSGSRRVGLFVRARQSQKQL